MDDITLESLENVDRDKLIAAIIKYDNYSREELKSYTHEQLCDLLNFLFINSQIKHEGKLLFDKLLKMGLNL